MLFDKGKFKFLWRSGGTASLAILGILFVLVFVVFYKLIPVIRTERINNVKHEISRMTSYFQQVIYSMEKFAIISIDANQQLLSDEKSLQDLCRIITKSDSLIIGSSITMRNQVSGYLEKATFNSEFCYDTWDELNEYFKQDPEIDFKVGKMTRLHSYPEPVTSFSFKYCINDDSLAFVTLFSSLSIQRSIHNVINPFPEGVVIFVSEDSLIMSCPFDNAIGKPAYQWVNEKYGEGKLDIEVLTSMDEINVHINKQWTILSSMLPISYRQFIYILPTSILTSDIRPLYVLFFVICNVAFFLILTICYIFVRKNMTIAIQLEKNRTEFTTASYFQRSLLSSAMASQSVDIGAVLQPAMAIGGDLYYYFERDGNLYFCIGDVSGKGVSAALVMSYTVRLFREMSRFDVPLETLVDQMNKSLCENNEICLFVTMFVGVMNLEKRILSYCNAGHDEPLLWNGNSSFFLKTVRNLPFGVVDNASYKEESISLDDNFVLQLYTDGVTEALNELHQEYGMERLKSLFDNVNKDSSSDDINKALLDDIHSFVGENEQSDDITILTIKMRHDKSVL